MLLSCGKAVGILHAAGVGNPGGGAVASRCRRRRVAVAAGGHGGKSLKRAVNLVGGRRGRRGGALPMDWQGDGIAPIAKRSDNTAEVSVELVRVGRVPPPLGGQVWASGRSRGPEVGANQEGDRASQSSALGCVILCDLLF